MKKIERSGFLIYGLIGSAVLIFSGLLIIAGVNPFRPFFGPLPPLAVMAGTILFGLGSLVLLQEQAGIGILWRESIRSKEPAPGAAHVPIGALLFFLPVLSADLLFRFPEALNVLLPAALLFYPAIGFVAETVFHLIPAAAALIIDRAIRKNAWEKGAPILLFLPAMLTEPIFQLLFAEELFAATTIFTFFHVFAISMFQIHLLRKHGFLAMFLFRLCYYLLWHVLWGSLRLELLF